MPAEQKLLGGIVSIIVIVSYVFLSFIFCLFTCHFMSLCPKTHSLTLFKGGNEILRYYFYICALKHEATHVGYADLCRGEVFLPDFV